MRLLLIRSRSVDAERNMAAFRAAGFVADHARTVEDAITFVREYAYDVIVLEGGATGAEGCAAIRRLRNSGDDTPILVLNDHPSSDLAVDALHAGADDVLGGTYRAEEMVARAEAIVRRSHGYATSTLRVGPLAIDLTGHCATVNGEALHLRRKEFEVLEMLALRRGRILSRQQIVDLLYDGMSSPDEGIVGVYICMLRKKLAECGAAGLVETVRGYGYVLDPAAAKAPTRLARTFAPAAATEMRLH